MDPIAPPPTLNVVRRKTSLAKIIAGKAREASPAVMVLAVLFAIKFAVTG